MFVVTLTDNLQYHGQSTDPDNNLQYHGQSTDPDNNLQYHGQSTDPDNISCKTKDKMY